MKHVIKDEQKGTCTWSMAVAANGNLNIYVNGTRIIYFRPDGRAFRVSTPRFLEKLGFKTTTSGAIKFDDED